MTTYNPTEYWLKRGKTYYQEFANGWDKSQEQALVDYLKTIDFKSVLEVGCGFGRITKVVYEEFKPEWYAAIDLSPDQIARAKQYVPEVTFVIRSIQEPQSKFYYDLVLAVEVLLHILPSEIEQVIAKLLQMGKHLVHIDPIAYPGEMQPHNFIHDYTGIYRKLGAHVNTVPIPSTGQHVVHAWI